MGKLILVLGGGRSGKSSFAQQLAEQSGDTVKFVATALPTDEEMRERIRKHVEDRPSEWETIEAPYDADEAAAEIVKNNAAVLWDCVTVFVSNVLLKEQPEKHGLEDFEERLVERFENVLNSVAVSEGTLIAVSNEVGCGLIPPYELGRYFRDIAGRINRTLAEKADEVYFVAAGIPIELKRLSI